MDPLSAQVIAQLWKAAFLVLALRSGKLYPLTGTAWHKLTIGILKFDKVNSCRIGVIFVDATARKLASEMLPRIYRGYPRRLQPLNYPQARLIVFTEL